MQDAFADTFFERARKRMPGWLQNTFEDAVSSSPYALNMVALKRKMWREDGGISYRKETLPNGKQALFPYIAPPIIFGDLDKRTAHQLIEAIKIARRYLPNFLDTLLAESGLRIKAGKLLSHIDPTYKKMKVRGQQGVMDNVFGCYEPHTQSVLLTQGYISKIRGEFFLINQPTIIETLLHEFGHGVEDIIFPDDRNGPLRKNDAHYRDFVRAYREDVKQLNGATVTASQESITYYLDEEHGGTHRQESHAISELFAEMFMEKYVVSMTDYRSTFPNANRVLERILISLEHMIEKEPHVGAILYNEIPLLTAIVE